MYDTPWAGLADVPAVTVGASATRLLATEATAGRPYRAVLVTPIGAGIYFGGPNVSSTTGTPLAAGVTREFPIQRGGALFAVRNGGADVDVRIAPAY